MSYFLGVDGGATRSRAHLRDGAGRLLAQAEGSAANIYVDFDAAMDAIREVVARALALAGPTLVDKPRISLGLGVAGVLGEADSRRVEAALPAWGRVVAANDAVTACLGAHAGGAGGLIIAGTGSAGLARVEGRTTVVGGRGFLLGDDGSAARVGADALRAALRAFDGLEPMSGLSREILAHFHDDPVAMTTWALGAKPGQYGAFAPAVLRAAEAGETGALAIVGAAARAIAALAERLEELGAREIAISGGLAEPIRAFLSKSLSVRLSRPLFEPVDGAILLAGGAMPPSVETSDRA